MLGIDGFSASETVARGLWFKMRHFLFFIYAYRLMNGIDLSMSRWFDFIHFSTFYTLTVNSSMLD